MADSRSGVVDQALADRPADIATKAGAKLPQCWKGTIMSTSTRQYLEGGANYTCSDAWAGTIGFALVGGNAGSGSEVINLVTPATCTNPLVPGSTLPVQTIGLSIRGTQNTKGFTLRFAPTSHAPLQGGEFAGVTTLFSTGDCPFPPGPPLTVTLDRPNHATAKPQLIALLVRSCPGGSEQDVFTSRSTIELSGPS